MLKKGQIVAMVSIAIISFLLGTLFNVATGANGRENPWAEVWTAISELQTKVESRNEIITVTANPTWTLLTHNVWTELLSVPNVAVSEGATVVAITSAYFKCMEEAITPLMLRYRANNAYGENRWQGFSGIWADGAAREIVEIHHAWTNLTAGTYTFAIQYWAHPRELYVRSSRLTVMIFR